jgi:cytochrome c-type biogenesis protein CcmH/NrfG
LDPSYAAAEGNLGHALLSNGNLDNAIPHLRRAVELAPESAEFHDDLGQSLAEKGQTDEAIPHFERALQLEPNLVEAHYFLGMALVMKGRRAEGLAHWRQALRKDPDNVQVLNETAWVLATTTDDALRNGGEAVALAEHAAQLTSGREPAVLGTLAAAYAETGSYDRAIDLEQKAADLATRQGNAPLAEMLSQRLTLFNQKTPVRQK